MDVGVANTTRTYTGRWPLIGRMWEKRKRRPSNCARPVSPCGAHPPGKHRSPSCTSARAALRILSRFRAGMRLLSSPLVHRGAESREVGQDRLVPQVLARATVRASARAATQKAARLAAAAVQHNVHGLRTPKHG